MFFRVDSASLTTGTCTLRLRLYPQPSGTAINPSPCPGVTLLDMTPGTGTGGWIAGTAYLADTVTPAQGKIVVVRNASSAIVGNYVTEDNGIGRVTIRVNGIVQADTQGLGAAPILTLPDGMDTVEVTLEDTQGNGTTRSFRALVDTHGPAVSMSAPVLTSVTCSTFTLRGSLSDLVSGYASLTVNGTPVVPTLTGDFEVQVPLTRGTNTIALEAVDRLGNRTTQTFVVTSVVPQTRQHLITLEIGSPSLTVDGISQPIDAQGSAPVIQEGRTLLPIRVIVESLGGRIEWNARERKVTIVLASRTLELWIGKSTAAVAGVKTPIDAANPKVAPVIIKGRTYLPVRFIAENLGGSVSWDPATQTVTIASMK